MEPPHLDETVSASPDISPGLVQDDETLIRALFDPDHIKDGEVVPAAIPIKDLLQRGFSVQRRNFTTQELLEKLIDKYLSKPSGGTKRKFEGVAPLETREIRALTDDEKRLFVVIDKALECNPGHASIYLAETKVADSIARQHREKLMPFLNHRTSISEALAEPEEDQNLDSA